MKITGDRAGGQHSLYRQLAVSRQKSSMGGRVVVRLQVRQIEV